MKKTILSFAVLTAFVSSVAGNAFAASASFGPVPMSADVAGGLSITVKVFKNDITGTQVTSMDFGQLADIGTGTLRSNNSPGNAAAFMAYVSVNSHQLPMVLTSTGTALVNANSITLPTGACAQKPVFLASDNANGATGTAGSASPWIGTKTLYTSTGSHLAANIRQYLAVTDDPAAGSTGSVPPDQQSGHYAGQITYTVTA